MGFFSNLTHSSSNDRLEINKGVEVCRSTPGAVLVDVREVDEFAAGHVPGAVNLPLSVIGEAAWPKETPLYVYCLRGSRAKKAAEELGRMGYAEVYSIGGISQYKGPVEK